MPLMQVSTDLSGLNGYSMVEGIEVIDLGVYKIFGPREISDMEKVPYGEQGYTDGDRAVETAHEMSGYICTGENRWDRHGDATTYLPIMRKRLRLEPVQP